MTDPNVFDELIAEFNEQVYHGGLKGLIDAAGTKGMSGEFNGVRLLSFAALTQVGITIAKGNCSLTLTALDEGKQEGLIGVRARGDIDDIVQMVRDVISGWQVATDPAAIFVENPNVRPASWTPIWKD